MRLGEVYLPEGVFYRRNTKEKRPPSRQDVQILTFIHAEGESDPLLTDNEQSCTKTAQ